MSRTLSKDDWCQMKNDPEQAEGRKGKKEGKIKALGEGSWSVEF